MNKKLAALLLFDLSIGLLFLGTNWYIWNFINGKLTANNWGPLQIIAVPQTIIDGKAQVVGTYLPLTNYPFILFWVALIGNFAITAWLLAGKKKQDQ